MHLPLGHTITVPSRRQFLLISLPTLLAGCTTHDAFRIAESVARGNSIEGALASRAKSKATSWAVNPSGFAHDLEKFKSFLDKITGAWGDEAALRPEPKRYVKYTDNYHTRSVIDFEQGVVRVETLQPANLRQAIITALLSPEDPREIDLFSDQPVPLGGTPFLHMQVVDHEGKPVRWAWRAEHFADYLVANSKQKRQIQLPEGQSTEEVFVEFPLVLQHRRKRQYRYSEIVERYSRKYNVDSALVYAVIETESNFNPFAVSWVPAYGLMQIVPTTAGRDAYELIHGKSGTPSSSYLFNVDNNIRMGTAYLHILKTRYLSQVRHPLSKEYCVVAAYNGGAGNVLKCFSKNRSTAFKAINQLPPNDVYARLRRFMPIESQRYLVKVQNAKKRYV